MGEGDMGPPRRDSFEQGLPFGKVTQGPPLESQKEVPSLEMSPTGVVLMREVDTGPPRRDLFEQGPPFREVT